MTLSANATPQQDSAPPSLPFSVTIQDPCPSTIISFPFTSLAAMSNTVTLASVSYTFGLATDSKSYATAIASLCGQIEYSIVEAYSFITVIAGSIILGSNSMLHIGPYTATL